MHTAPMNPPTDSAHQRDLSRATEARLMTQAQLQELGMSECVYVRAGMIEGQPAYAIYAADGTPMAIAEDIELAVELVLERGLMFVPVH